MRRSLTQYLTATSLDGFVATPEHSLAWLFRLPPPPAKFEDFMAGVGAVAMGSGTYEWLLREHIKPGSRRPKPWPHRQPTWVFSSRRLPSVPGADLRFVHGDVRPVHRAMRRAAGGRNIWLAGGGHLAAQFLAAGLLDEIILHVAGVTLGSGKPLLPLRHEKPHLRLESATRLNAAFVELRYRVPHPRRGRSATKS